MLTVVDLLLPHFVSRSYSDSDCLFDASRRDAEAETTHCLWLVGGSKGKSEPNRVRPFLAKDLRLGKAAGLDDSAVSK